MANNDVKIKLSAEDKTKAAFDSAKRNISDLSSSAAGLAGTFGLMLPAATLAGMASMVKSTIDAADAMNDMSVRTGVAVKDLAAMKLAAEQNGTSLDDVARGMQKLTLSISQAEGGSKEMAASLKALGITARDPREALFQLADAVRKSGDNSQIAADLQKVLGKSYAELLPLLSQGSEELRSSAKASETFAEAMAKAAPDADEFNDSIARMQQNLATVAVNLSGPIVKSLNDVAKAFAGTNKEASDLGGVYGKAVAVFFQTISVLGANVWFVLEGVGREIGGIAAQMAALAHLDFDAYRFIGETMKEDAKAARAELDALEKRLMSVGETASSVNKKTSTENSAGNQGKINQSLSGASKSDPLASLLASTDLGKLKKFESDVALLNARFDYGRKSTELYTQAMTRLVETSFSDSFKRAADDAEFLRMVEEDGIRTTQEWRQNLQDLANMDMARLNGMLANTDFARLKQDQDDMVLLTKAFTEGIKDADGNIRKLSEAEYLDAVKNRLRLVGDEAESNADIFKRMGDSINSSLEDAIINGGDFSDVLQGLKHDVISLGWEFLKAQFNPGGGSNAASTFSTLASIGSFLFSEHGNAFSANSGLSAYANSVVTRPTVFPFARGIGLMGEESGAPGEAIMPLKRMSGGDLGVKVEGAGGGGNHVTVTQHINIDSRTDQSVIMAAMARAKNEAVAAINQSLARGGTTARLAGVV